MQRVEHPALQAGPSGCESHHGRQSVLLAYPNSRGSALRAHTVRVQPPPRVPLSKGPKLRQRSSRLLSGGAGRKSLRAHQICGSENGATSSLVRTRAFGHEQRVRPPSGISESSELPRSPFSLLRNSIRFLALSALYEHFEAVRLELLRLIIARSPVRVRPAPHYGAVAQG